MSQLDTAVITKTNHGFEMTDSAGENIGNFRDWDQVAEMFRQQDFSEEYIAKRKTDPDKQKIAESFHVKGSLDEVDFAAEDDITPGTYQPVVFTNDEGERDLELMYWGFTFPTRLTFNTRSGSILKPGLWKSSFEDRRCIVPADSFFEWKRLHKKNNPKYEISVKGGHPFALAGIWSRWKNKAGRIRPYSIGDHFRAQ